MQNSAQYQQSIADAIATAENHANLGKSLQANGVRLLNAIPMSNDGRKIDLENHEAGEIAQLINNATAAITRGIKIEQDARTQIIRYRAAQAEPAKDEVDE